MKKHFYTKVIEKAIIDGHLSSLFKKNLNENQTNELNKLIFESFKRSDTPYINFKNIEIEIFPYDYVMNKSLEIIKSKIPNYREDGFCYVGEDYSIYDMLDLNNYKDGFWLDEEAVEEAGRIKPRRCVNAPNCSCQINKYIYDSYMAKDYKSAVTSFLKKQANMKEVIGYIRHNTTILNLGMARVKLTPNV